MMNKKSASNRPALLKLIRLCLFRGGMFAAVAVVFVIGFLFLILRPLSAPRREVIVGPASPAGYQVEIRVSDCGPGVGADFYADIWLLDPDRRKLIEWHDPDGQDSWDGVDRLIASMRWATPTSLAFTSDSRTDCELAVPQLPPNK